MPYLLHNIIHRCIFRPLSCACGAVLASEAGGLGLPGVSWGRAGASVAKLSAAPCGSGPSQPPAASLATAATAPRPRVRELRRPGRWEGAGARGAARHDAAARSRGHMERDVKWGEASTGPRHTDLTLLLLSTNLFQSEETKLTVNFSQRNISEHYTRTFASRYLDERNIKLISEAAGKSDSSCRGRSRCFLHIKC